MADPNTGWGAEPEADEVYYDAALNAACSLVQEDNERLRDEIAQLAMENSNLRVAMANLREQLEYAQRGRVRRALRAFWEELVA